MKILGLDISTSTIGLSVIDYGPKKNEVIHIDYYKPIKGTIEDKNIDLLYMLSEAKKHILHIIETYQPEYIAVEDYIRFMKGSSGASTIIPLATLNRTICLAVYESYPLIPLYICNVMSIRTRIKKDIGRQDLPPKEEIPDIMEKLLKIKIPRPMKQTRKGPKEMIEREDMADSIAVSYYCRRMMEEKK